MRAVLMWLVRAYRLVLSPYLGGNCRFHPTFSEYMLTALQRHGSATGVKLGLSRLLRCHPFRPGGVDPVPE